jgi:ribosomal protein L16 Arg81 hydroxylase
MLNEILVPIDINDFWSEYYEKKHLVIHRNNNDFYGKFINLTDVNDVLNVSELTSPKIRLIKQGINLPKEQFLDDNNFIDKKKLFNLYHEGATIRIQQANNSIKKLNSFCKKIGYELNMEVMSNIYITPKNSFGFNPHEDTHDVIIFQIFGSKNWNIYDIPFELPLPSQKLSNDRRKLYKNTSPNHTLLLNQGDLLYIPRGLVHDAFTQNETSIHITIGLHPHRNIDLLIEIIELAKMNLVFRKSLVNTDSHEVVKNEIINLVNDYFSQKQKPSYINNANFDNTFLSIENINTLNENSFFIFNEENIEIEYKIDSKKIDVNYNSQPLSFPLQFKKMFFFMLECKKFKYSDIPKDFDIVDLKDFALILVLNGLLQVIEQ